MAKSKLWSPVRTFTYSDLQRSTSLLNVCHGEKYVENMSQRRLGFHKLRLTRICVTRSSPFEFETCHTILELCVRTFTCEHVYVVLATLASAFPREIQDKLLALQRLFCFFLVFLFALSSQLLSFRITSESLCLVPPLV